MRQETQNWIRALRSIPEAGMRAYRMATLFDSASSQETFHTLNELISLGGGGNLDVSQVLSALVLSLEPPSQLSYETRAELYAIASEKGVPEIAYILLEGDSEEHDEAEDMPRAIVPGGTLLTLGARKSAARTSDRLLLTHLIHDPSMQVVPILLKNPHLVEADVLVMASKRPADPAVLRHISGHNKWSQSRRIRNAIVLNPASPLSLACRLCLDMRGSDLKTVTRNAGSPALLRGHAERLMQKRRQSERH